MSIYRARRTNSFRRIALAELSSGLIQVDRVNNTSVTVIRRELDGDDSAHKTSGRRLSHNTGVTNAYGRRANKTDNGNCEQTSFEM